MPNNLEKGAPLPASIGGCADLYHDIRELRLEMERQVADIRARETEIREHIINSTTVNDRGGVGQRYKAVVIAELKPTVKDWNVFFPLVAKLGRFDFLQKRISEAALMEAILDNGKIPPPGVELISVKTVSITKI
jgi:hypothetical protein